MTSSASGAGLGLRIPHIQYVLTNKPHVAWFEVHICNFLKSTLNRALLRQIAEHYPLCFHGVSMNLGGTDAIDSDYLSRLKAAVNDFEPVLVSEHVCFTAMGGAHFHDLLPIPFTKEALAHITDRIDQVQNALGRRLLIENVSRYTDYSESTMSEGEFISELSKRTGCGILLDVNNAYVNQINLGESLEAFVSALLLDKVEEIHLAGASNTPDGRLIDTHSCAVSDEVWTFYQYVHSLLPNVPCLIEWDSDLPSFKTLLHERDKAQAIFDTQLFERALVIE